MEDDDTASLTNTMPIIEQFKGLYGNQLQKVDSNTYDGLKMKTNILESYVKDLTDQNTYLLQAVEELESESLKRLNALEANLLSKSESHKTSTSQLELGQADAIGSLRKELCKKDQLVEKYRQQIEELKESFGRSCKQHSHHYSMCDQEFERSSIEQPPTGVELESTQAQVCQLEKEVNQLKKKLKEAECSGKRLICDLTACEKNAREMRAALTSEVAEKHDQILALRREVSQLEEQLRQADMQTHFKDDIIKELRKEVKVARSKLEFLGLYPTSNKPKREIVAKPDKELIETLTDVNKEVHAILRQAQSDQGAFREKDPSPVRQHKSENLNRDNDARMKRTVTTVCHDNPNMVLERTHVCPVHGDVSVWTTLCTHSKQ